MFLKVVFFTYKTKLVSYDQEFTFSPFCNGDAGDMLYNKFTFTQNILSETFILQLTFQRGQHDLFFSLRNP